MKIVFCCLGDFRGPPGAKQLLLLAQALTDAGHQTLLLLEGDPATIRLVGGGAGEVEVDRYSFIGPVLSRRTRRRVAAFQPDLVHCYEPRTGPLAAALTLAAEHHVPLCVRFADDDEALYREAGGVGLRRAVGRPALLAAGTVFPKRWPYKHPLWHRRMLARAAAYDAIISDLAAEITERYAVRCEGILPALPARVPPVGGSSAVLRANLGLPADGRLLVYTGSIFRAHFDDFKLLLIAFGSVARRHPDVQFVHTGRVAERYKHGDLRALAGPGASDRMHFLGFLEDPHQHEALQAEAYALLQPGAPTDFNRLRLPAKVPDYLMTGRPVVTFEVGLGQLLEDRYHAVLTQTGDPEELAEAISFLLEDANRARAIGAAGRARALELFAPDRIAAQTFAYYERAVSCARRCDTTGEPGSRAPGG